MCKAGLTLPRYVTFTVYPRQHMHHHLDVQICSMIGATVTAMIRLLDVQKSHSTYGKEDFFGKA